MKKTKIQIQKSDLLKGSFRDRKCKIIGTIGPSSNQKKVLTDLVLKGLDIARLNFSHGDHKTHKLNIDLIRQVSLETGISVTILQDLQGPKIRCGYLMNDYINLKKDKIYSLVYGKEQTSEDIIPIDYQDLVSDVEVNQRVMMDDGLLILKIQEVTKKSVKVKVIEGGKLKSRKGVNFPDSILSLPILSKKDTKDLIFGVQNNLDMIALSFVQTVDDVLYCKKVIQALGADLPVISKIEKISAVESISEIAKVSDGIMIARGDLGVEGNIEKVPSFQKKIIANCVQNSKPVIIATQVLESMTSSPYATFAERSDIAGGVLEGADCLMLSAEVATGKYPVHCIKTMDETIKAVEKWTIENPDHNKNLIRSYLSNYGKSFNNVKLSDEEAISLSACEAAELCNASLIVCVSLTGSMAKSISRWRPSVPVVTLSPRSEVIRRLNLLWGVSSVQNPLFYNTDSLIHSLPELLKKLKIVKAKDIIVITAGIPINQLKSTNMVKINKIA